MSASVVTLVAPFLDRIEAAMERDIRTGLLLEREQTAWEAGLLEPLALLLEEHHAAFIPPGKGDPRLVSC